MQGNRLNLKPDYRDLRSLPGLNRLGRRPRIGLAARSLTRSVTDSLSRYAR